MHVDPPPQATGSPPRTLTNDDIEAIIQLATSSQPSPSPHKDTRTQLFVGNLPYRVRWQDLKDLFRRAGTVLRADVSLGPDNRSRGYGTVLLATAEDAGRAIDIFHGYSWQSRILEVRPDRLPPDFDAAIPPNFVSPTSLSAPSSRDELHYSALLDFHHTITANPCRNLFVGNLPFHCQWQDLKDLFRQAGTIIRADVALGPDGRSRGFGTVTFATELDAERALKMFNGFEYNGRPLKVNYDKFMQMSQSIPSSPVPPSATPQPLAFPSTLNRWAPSPVQLQRFHPSPEQRSEIPSPAPPVQHDPWLSQFEVISKNDHERELGLSQAFRRLDIDRPASPPLFELAGSVSGVSRSTSTSSSTRPPSLTTTSSGSGLSSSSSLPAPSALELPLTDYPSLQHPRRLSTSHDRKPSFSSSSSSSRASPPSLPRSLPGSQSTMSSHLNKNARPFHRSPSSRNSQHPHRPGPITLPPPPIVSSFHLARNRPKGASPLHSPTYPRSSHPAHHRQQQQSAISMPPQGLPPITPSMPSFNFLPPLPSPGLHGGAQHGYPLPSPSFSIPYPYQSALPSPPIHQGSHPTYHPHQIGPFGIAPLSPLPSPGIHTSSTITSAPPLPNGHHPRPSAFSPGLAMSPGAFWGRPGCNAANPMINPAVGAPVHVVQMSPYAGEPAGYFEGYFPPVPGVASGGAAGAAAMESEILKETSVLSGVSRGDVDAGSASRGEEGDVMNESGAADEVKDDRQGDGNNADGDGRPDGGTEHVEEPRVFSDPVVTSKLSRRHSSTADASPWQLNTSRGKQDGDLRVWEGREGEPSRRGNFERETAAGDTGAAGGASGSPVAESTLVRAHSLSASAKARGMSVSRPVPGSSESSANHAESQVDEDSALDEEDAICTAS